MAFPYFKQGIKILLKRYTLNHDKSCVRMKMLVRPRATKHRKLEGAVTGAFYVLG